MRIRRSYNKRNFTKRNPEFPKYGWELETLEEKEKFLRLIDAYCHIVNFEYGHFRPAQAETVCDLYGENIKVFCNKHASGQNVIMAIGNINDNNNRNFFRIKSSPLKNLRIVCFLASDDNNAYGEVFEIWDGEKEAKCYLKNGEGFDLVEWGLLESPEEI